MRGLSTFVKLYERSSRELIGIDLLVSKNEKKNWSYTVKKKRKLTEEKCYTLYISVKMVLIPRNEMIPVGSTLWMK